ncbi:MAG: putative metal-binding motif-containing protein, partial [Myxococcales bacterium]|nr:putative metal-binding motif-containing protein [Myxococcales bacterium]
MITALVLAACTPPAAPLDADGDGVDSVLDCDDADPFVLPGAPEICDGHDNDCNGLVDDDPIDVATWSEDADGDGFGSALPGAAVTTECAPGPGWSRDRSDCDDTDATIHPAAVDDCDGIDNDCDGVVDDEPAERYLDADGDGYGRRRQVVRTCEIEGTAAVFGDCRDGDPTVNPGQPEVCNGIDDDCDRGIDDADPEGPMDPGVWAPDQDLDGVGVSGVFDWIGCEPPSEHWALATGDCNDLDPLTFPGAVQRCSGVDNDCDGSPPTDDAWWDPDWPYRVRATVRAGADGAVEPLLLVDLDARAVLDELGDSDPFDPDAMVVVVQSCDTGARVLDSAFTDALTGLLQPTDPTDPLGDEIGTVHALYDASLAADEVIPIALYLGGPTSVPAPGVVVDERGWSGPVVEVGLDPDRGGLLDDVIPSGGPNVLSQADASEGNGVRGPGGSWLLATSPGTTSVLASGPRVAAVTGESEHVGLDGAFRLRTWWWGYADHPAVYVKIHLVTTAPTTLDDPTDALLALRPFQATSPGLTSPVVATTGSWTSRSAGGWGAGFSWVRPPAFEGELVCDGDACWTSAADVSPGTASAVVPAD